MQTRSRTSSLLVYFGAVAAALSVTVLGLAAVVKSSAALSDTGAREKTLLELQVESSREIRRALATPMVTAPLPPITARPARDLRAAAASPQPARPKLPQAAMDAMAMDQGGAYRSAGQNYSVPDRHTSY
jgi:hypothetical protein